MPGVLWTVMWLTPRGLVRSSKREKASGRSVSCRCVDAGRHLPEIKDLQTHCVGIICRIVEAEGGAVDAGPCIKADAPAF